MAGKGVRYILDYCRANKVPDTFLLLFAPRKGRLMPSPFPGMDPYLEAHWRDVHAGLIIYARRSGQAKGSGVDSGWQEKGQEQVSGIF